MRSEVQSRARLIAIIANAPAPPGCIAIDPSAVARCRAGSCEITGPWTLYRKVADPGGASFTAMAVSIRVKRFQPPA